jgi:hypothetical protein
MASGASNLMPFGVDMRLIEDRKKSELVLIESQVLLIESGSIEE